jgi:hypothetical protein
VGTGAIVFSVPAIPARFAIIFLQRIIYLFIAILKKDSHYLQNSTK